MRIRLRGEELPYRFANLAHSRIIPCTQHDASETYMNAVLLSHIIILTTDDANAINSCCIKKLEYTDFNRHRCV
jgi:hypothetical protein